MKATLLVWLAVKILAASAVSKFYEDLSSLPRETGYSYTADGFLTQSQDSELKRTLSEYQDRLNRRSLNEYSYSRNEVASRTSFDGQQPGDIYADVEVKRAIVTTVPANTSVCVGGFAVDSAGDAWCQRDAYNARRRAYEVRILKLASERVGL